MSLIFIKTVTARKTQEKKRSSPIETCENVLKSTKSFKTFTEKLEHIQDQIPYQVPIDCLFYLEGRLKIQEECCKIYS